MSRFMFRNDVVKKWQSVWDQVCLMAYEHRNITDKIIVHPDSPMEQYFYERNKCSNAEEITLDHMWQKYSYSGDNVFVIPELQRIYVPRSLFECLGVYAWFKYSFPNCVIDFWEDAPVKKVV